MNVTLGFGLDRIGQFIGTTALEKDIYGFHSYMPRIMRITSMSDL